MEQARQHVSLKPATVVLVNEDGTYRVLPDSGRGYGAPIDGVRPIVEEDFDIGDRVVLVWERPGEHPRILTSGGGSSACVDCLDNFGMVAGS